MDIVDKTTTLTLSPNIVDALNKILPEFCQDWNIPVPTISFIQRWWVTKSPIKIYVYETKLPSKGVHMQENGVPYAKIYLKSARDIHIISHEIFELLVNPIFDQTFEKDGILYKKEVCDPVSKTFYVDGIPISDWILPSWFGGSPPYNHLNTLRTPFSLDGGYLELQ